MAEKYNLQETVPTEKIEAPRSNRIYPVSYEGEITAEEERKKSMAALPANLAGIALYADDYIRQKQYLDYSNDIETLALQQKLDRANEERDLAAEKGNEITNAYIRLQSRIDDVNKVADSDLSVDRVAGIQEVFDDERLLADEQPLYVRERLVDQLDRSQPFYMGKAREAHHNEQIAVAKNNILFRANQLGSAVLDGKMDQETALKEFANAFIPYIGSGKNPGLFSFVDASNAYQSFFQDVVKNTVEGIILRAKSAEEAEKAVKAELAWADKQYLQFMTENGPATFDDGKPMGLWVSAEPNTKEWAYGRLASFKKKEEEKSTFNKADWEKLLKTHSV